ncbi:MAG: hypothetical protein R3B84_02905 [Zavarzinella sp.]
MKRALVAFAAVAVMLVAFESTASAQYRGYGRGPVIVGGYNPGVSIGYTKRLSSNSFLSLGYSTGGFYQPAYVVPRVYAPVYPSIYGGGHYQPGFNRGYGRGGYRCR